MFSDWLATGTLPDNLTDSSVVALFKKGDPSIPANYRPISLLNTSLKIYAAAIQRRLRRGVDHILQRTQYGFHRGKSTIDAIQCMRRIIDKAERGGRPLGIVFIDWEKAFDRIDRTALVDTLHRYNVPVEIINAIKGLYSSTMFQVRFRGGTSETQEQHTGIRQGCPLSPLPLHNRYVRSVARYQTPPRIAPPSTS